MLEQGDFAEGQEKEVILGDTKKSIQFPRQLIRYDSQVFI